MRVGRLAPHLAPAPNASTESIIASAVRESKNADLIDQAYRAGAMAFKLSRSGLPYQALVAKWGDDMDLPRDVRNSFWRAIDDAPEPW